MNRKRSSSAFVFLLHFAFCALLIGYSYWAIQLTGTRDKELALKGTCLFALILLIWGLVSWRITAGSAFNPYSIFFIMAGLFNAGQLYLEIFGLNELGLLDGLFSVDLLLQSAVLVVICLAFLHLGALFITLVISIVKAGGPRTPYPGVREIAFVGWILLVMSILPALSEIRNALRIALSQGYRGLYQQEETFGIDNWSSILAAFLIPALVFILVGSRGHRLTVACTALAIVAYTLVYLFVGRRAEALIPAVAFLWAYDRVISRVPRSILVGGVVVLTGVILPGSRVFRDTAGQDRLSAGYFWQTFVGIENPVVATIAEMGGSLRTVAHTLDLVPAYRSFDNGLSYLYGALTVVPNLFWDTHPAVERPTPSNWLIWTVEPIAASLGSGLGYSFIAEAYLNFGWIGAPVITALVGAGFAGLSCWAHSSKSPLVVAGTASFLSFTLFYVRSESALLFRPAVWYALAPCLLVLVIRLTTRADSTDRRISIPLSTYQMGTRETTVRGHPPL